MAYKIDEKITKKTRCENNYICLENGICPKNKCKPTGSINGFLWVKTKAKTSCEYHMSFTDKDICRCPTRNELYKRYKI